MIVTRKRRGFGEAVTFVDDLADYLLPLLRYRRGHRRRSGKAVAHITEAFLDVRHVQKPLIYRRHTEEHGDFIGFKRMQNRFGIEALVQNERGARIETGVHDEVLSETMKQRQKADQSVIGRHLSVTARP